MNPDYKPAFQDAEGQAYYNERVKEYNLDGYKDWEQSHSGGKTFTVSVLSGPDAGGSLDYYYYSEARRKRDELLAQGICAIMRLDNGN